MFKLEIENFQSIQDKTEIDFVQGVNLIVGPSNSGKSACLRALRGLILNYMPSSKARKYISHFQDEARVSLQLKPNEIYKWYKSEKGTQYEIDRNGEIEPFKKCGNNTLFDIVPDLPFVLRDKKLINTHTEHDGLPFPFGMSDIELFKVFEDLYNVSSSATIFKFMKKLETQTNSEINTLESNIHNNWIRIEAIVEVQDKFDLEKLENKKQLAETLYSNSSKLINDFNKAKENNTVSKQIKEVLEKVVDFSEDLKIIEEYKALNEAYRKANKNSEIEKINVYTKDFDLSVIEPYKALSSDFNKLQKLENEVKELDSEEAEALEELKEIESQLAEIKICPLCGNKLKEK